MVIFNSYVKLPEGLPQFWDKLWSKTFWTATGHHTRAELLSQFLQPEEKLQHCMFEKDVSSSKGYIYIYINIMLFFF